MANKEEKVVKRLIEDISEGIARKAYKERTVPLNIEPSIEEKTYVPEEKYIIGYNPVIVSAVDSSIDSNIQPENIKSDVEILGVTGTLEPVGPYIDDTDTVEKSKTYHYFSDSGDRSVTFTEYTIENPVGIPIRKAYTVDPVQGLVELPDGDYVGYLKCNSIYGVRTEISRFTVSNRMLYVYTIRGYYGLGISSTTILHDKKYHILRYFVDLDTNRMDFKLVKGYLRFYIGEAVSTQIEGLTYATASERNFINGPITIPCSLSKLSVNFDEDLGQAYISVFGQSDTSEIVN